MQLQTMNIFYTHAFKSVIDPAITSGKNFAIWNSTREMDKAYPKYPR